jgi:hypothetical protein
MSRSVASASKAKFKAKEAHIMDETLIADYLARLQSAMGDDDAFMPIFEALKLDKGIRQPEAVELASRFTSPLAPSTPKGKALEYIRKRHKALYIFRLKQDAMGGRSAA